MMRSVKLGANIVGFAAVAAVGVLNGHSAHCAPETKEESKFGVNKEQLRILEKIKKDLALQLAKKVEEEEDPETIMAWEKEKSGCSFCQYFLHSPCATPFRKWSKCVDLAKAENLDYVTTCSDYTDALMKCTEEKAEYFAAMRDSNKTGGEVAPAGVDSQT